MHISEIKITAFKSINHPTHIQEISPTCNIIIGPNGAGKSNILSALSLIFTPTRLSSEDKQSLINEGNVLNQKKAEIVVRIEDNDRFPFKKNFSIKRVFDMRSDEYSVQSYTDTKYNNEDVQQYSKFKSTEDINLKHINEDVQKSFNSKINEDINNHKNLTPDKEDVQKHFKLKINEDINSIPEKDNINKSKLKINEDINSIPENVNINKSKLKINEDINLIPENVKTNKSKLQNKTNEETHLNTPDDIQKFTKDEMSGIYDSINLTNNNHFIIQQGKINKLSLLTDKERLDLIKEVAGASVYERDRCLSVEMLRDSLKTEERIRDILGNIEERIVSLERDRRRVKEYEEGERFKREIEVCIFRKERDEVEERLASFEDNGILKSRNVYKNNIYNFNNDNNDNNDSNNENNINDNKDNNDNNDKNDNVKDIFYEEKKKAEKVIERLKYKINTHESVINITDKKKALNSNTETLKKLYLKKEELEKQLNKLKDDERSNKIILQAGKYELDFLKIFEKNKLNFNIQDELEEALSEIKKTRNEIKMIGKIEHSETKDGYKRLEELISERNKLWVEERKCEAKRKSLVENYQECYNRITKRAGAQFMAYQDIKGQKGVHGCVFEVLNAPEELLNALENVAMGSLFHVIVDTEALAIELLQKAKSRITFLPLDRISEYAEGDVKIQNAILLSSQIRCRDIYSPVLRMVTKNAYLVSDVKTGVILSKTYKVNVVTIEGDYISHSGSMSGGYENKGKFLAEIKKKELDIKNNEIRINEISTSLTKLNKEIVSLNEMSSIMHNLDNKESHLDTLRAIELFQERKINILHNKSRDTADRLTKAVNDLKIKGLHIRKEIQGREVEIEETDFNIRNTRLEIELNTEEIERQEMLQEYKRAVQRLERLNEQRILEEEKENEKFFNRYKIKNLEEEKRKVCKKALLEKRNELTRKIGCINNAYNENGEPLSDLSMQALCKKLCEVNERLKRYANVNKKAVIQFDEYTYQRQNLCTRMEELRVSRLRIEEFIKELDEKKEDAINLTFSMLKDNFRYFYSKLSPGNTADMILEGTSVYVKINNERVENLKKLSGGQKTIIALSFIFSIQKIDPSPFYIFDEIDANLDRQSRLLVAQLIKEVANSPASKTQYFITTFREEMLMAGDSFYGVHFENKNSRVSKITKEEAFSFVCDQQPASDS